AGGGVGGGRGARSIPRGRGRGATTKRGVTVVSAVIVTTQVPVPVQPPPLQPVKVEPVAGVAVNVTWVPVAYEAAHAVPQLMPPELLVTVPPPAPNILTVSVGPVRPPVPVTTRDIESPSAVKVTFTLCVVKLVGAKRTVTVWVAPAALRLKGLPETMVNAAGTDAVPITPARLLWTVKLCSAKLPRLTLPKATVVVGVTLMSGIAVALATPHHPLVFPPACAGATGAL